MAITRTPMVDDDGSGLTGTIINNAWKQELYGQIDAALPITPAWVDVPYAASNFVGSGSMIWTVEAIDVQTYAYLVAGKQLFLSFSIQTSSIGGTPDAILEIRFPAGIVAARAVEGMGWMADDVGPGHVRLRVTGAGASSVVIYKFPTYATWRPGTNTTQVAGQLFVPIN